VRHIKLGAVEAAIACKACANVGLPMTPPDMKNIELVKPLPDGQQTTRLLKRVHLLGIALFLHAASALACINSFDQQLPALMYKGDPKEIAAALADQEQKYAKTPSLEFGNDLAVAKIFAGHYGAAITLLQTLEQRYPGGAKTASNLGTAFELVGNNAQALNWIKEGIRRNPEDHYGTEWLHVKILQAKIAVAADPNWLKHNHVLGVSFGDGSRAVAPASLPSDHLGNAIALADVSKAIDYQLDERLKFVTPPDAIIADLFFARGDLADLSHGFAPVQYYQAALKFGAENTDVIELRIAQQNKDNPVPLADQIRDVARSAERTRQYITLLSVMLLAALGYWLMRRARKT
jgi:tetratricopeptide (TPR) repeat protein